MNHAELAATVPLLIPITYFVALVIEARWPARRFPERRGWRWLGVAFLVLIGMVGATVPLQYRECPPENLRSGICRFDFNASILTSMNGADRTSGLGEFSE